MSADGGQSEDEEARYPCPACGSRLYAWAVARDPIDRSEIVLDHCEDCGLVVTREPRPPDVDAELAALERRGGAVLAPNRESIQGGIGGPGWAGLEPDRRRLHLTPRAAKLLLRGQGVETLESTTPFGVRSYLGMLQTMVNAFTLRDNFVRNARAGRLRLPGVRGRLAIGLDWVVSALVAVPLSVLAVPLELLGSAFGRGGVLRLETAPSAVATEEGGREPG